MEIPLGRTSSLVWLPHAQPAGLICALADGDCSFNVVTTSNGIQRVDAYLGRGTIEVGFAANVNVA